MTLAGDALRFLSAGSLGVLLGAALAEGLVLVPYWRSLPPPDFLSWYAANDRRLVGFFGPLTAAAVLLAVAAALVSAWEGHPGRSPAAVAAILSAIVVAMFPLYFQKANASFAAASIGTAHVAAELRRWARWHWVRTGIDIVALAAALLALR